MYDAFEQALLSLVRLVLGLLLLAHWIGCINFMAVRMYHTCASFNFMTVSM